MCQLIAFGITFTAGIPSIHLSSYFLHVDFGILNQICGLTAHFLLIPNLLKFLEQEMLGCLLTISPGIPGLPRSPGSPGGPCERKSLNHMGTCL